MEERICKGIFIPMEVWKDKSLTWNEKILFLEIDSFTSKDKDCFFSNEYIADLLQVTETTANKVLSSLIKKGFVVKTKFDGRRRFVKTAFSFDRHIEATLPCSNEQPCLAVESNILNTSNNTSNKDKEDKSSLKKEEDEFVERMYKMYPSKCPKRNTSLGKCSKDKDRIRRLLKVYSKEDIEKVFKHEIESKYNQHFMSNLSTFINNFPDPALIADNRQELSGETKGNNLVIGGTEYR